MYNYMQSLPVYVCCPCQCMCAVLDSVYVLSLTVYCCLWEYRCAGLGIVYLCAVLDVIYVLSLTVYICCLWLGTCAILDIVYVLSLTLYMCWPWHYNMLSLTLYNMLSLALYSMCFKIEQASPLFWLVLFACLFVGAPVAPRFTEEERNSDDWYSKWQVWL